MISISRQINLAVTNARTKWHSLNFYMQITHLYYLSSPQRVPIESCILLTLAMWLWSRHGHVDKHVTACDAVSMLWRKSYRSRSSPCCLLQREDWEISSPSFTHFSSQQKERDERAKELIDCRNATSLTEKPRYNVRMLSQLLSDSCLMPFDRCLRTSSIESKDQLQYLIAHISISNSFQSSVLWLWRALHLLFNLYMSKDNILSKISALLLI